VLAITTPWPEFARLGPADLQNRPLVVDCWRMLSPEAREYVPEYFILGKGWAASNLEAEGVAARAD
jgi:hypothetical protein